MKQLMTCACALLLALGSAAPSIAGQFAGQYSDVLAKCLVQSSTNDDKRKLANWMFASVSLHPDVAHMSSMTREQRKVVNQSVAMTVTDLMTDACKDEATNAFMMEGAGAIQLSFRVFGQLAMKELFSDNAVAKGLAELNTHMEAETLVSKLGIK